MKRIPIALWIASGIPDTAIKIDESRFLHVYRDKNNDDERLDFSLCCTRSF